MSKIIKKLFGALIEKPWEENQVNIDNQHVGSTFKGVSSYVSAVKRVTHAFPIPLAPPVMTHTNFTILPERH